ncbi:hypothetical protein FSP39_025330 [Pinctada imbricata]|uniref:Uncharacterized protein n=1 Tax=Pinctada imbricata TaxID=66713 RepID=A0AA88XXM2_PINIB|nr:hypothetical protein FSP39_025330 [Pinctada imbricata]
MRPRARDSIHATLTVKAALKLLDRITVKATPVLKRTESMFSLIFPSLVSKQQNLQMTQNEVEKKAVIMLALLKTDEEKLIDDSKKLLKTDRSNARRVFSEPIHGWTLFHAAALRGCRKVVKLALKSGVDVNLKMGEPDGIPGECTALHLAAHRGDVSIIDVLLSNSAYVNERNSLGKTPVFYAIRAHNTLAVKTLKRAGADINVEDGSGSNSGPALTYNEDVNTGFRFLPFPGCSSTKTKR